ncbi:MAG: hypothetical protein WD336_11990, partial [Trueperaceae bacterium]
MARVAEAPVPDGFVVDQPGYQGDLAGLAHALRRGSLAPRDLDLPALVDAALIWFERRAATDLDGASVALPQVAQAIELKLRLLLPRPPTSDEDEDDEDPAATDALQAVAVLEELEQAIDFLRRRRQERATVVPARTQPPDLPRPRRPLRADVGTLAKMASHLAGSGYFEMHRERLSLDDALRRLRGALTRVARGTLRALTPTRSWAERTVVFAAFLELVREGRASARQEGPYGEIVVTARRHEAPAGR